MATLFSSWSRVAAFAIKSERLLLGVSSTPLYLATHTIVPLHTRIKSTNSSKFLCEPDIGSNVCTLDFGRGIHIPRMFLEWLDHYFAPSMAMANTEYGRFIR
ncbi:hypothetical protein BKA70DRAFT_205614 [Coprinopsis sp. MPI-PUGE-AT-0042]|nr:hypothetical protein BKA70DRAFT_205614 [Coprinopsis sp. MPI-PUGE-AT-0042]